MPPNVINSYTLQWNPNTKQMRIILDIGDGQPVTVPIATAEEFCVITLILNESPVYLFSDGTISTGWE